MVTVTRVAATASAILLARLMAERRSVTIYNDSQGFLLVRPGGVPTTTLFTVRIPPNDHWDAPAAIAPAEYQGLWTGDTTGGALVTEGF